MESYTSNLSKDFKIDFKRFIYLFVYFIFQYIPSKIFGLFFKANISIKFFNLNVKMSHNFPVELYF